MSRARVGFVIGLPLAVILLGLLLWWPPCPEPDRNSDLGAAIVGGGIVAFVVLYLDQVLSRRQERNLLRLQLGSASVFTGIDLSNQDLSGIYLQNRNMNGANLRGADLRGAVLSARTNLENAMLDGADLRGADLSGAVVGLLKGAIYDFSTRWPSGVDPRERGAINMDEQGRWRRTRQWIKDRASDIFG